MIVNCVVCGKSANIIPARVKKYKIGYFCSYKCQSIYKTKKIHTNCLCCQKDFTYNPSKIRYWCSRKCHDDYRKLLNTKSCIQCNKIFYSCHNKGGRKFCSNKCRSLNERNRIHKNCLQCNKEFITWPCKPTNKFCSMKCRDKYYIGPKHNCWNHNRSHNLIIYNNKRPRDLKFWSKAIKKRDEYKCQMCGDIKNLTSHHIYNFLQYPERAFEINNGIALCKNCHNFTLKKENIYSAILSYILYSKNKLSHKNYIEVLYD